MELFQALLLIGLGFCLGRMFHWLNKEWRDTCGKLVHINHIVRIQNHIIHILVIAVTIIYVFLLVGLIGPYIQ